MLIVCLLALVSLTPLGAEVLLFDTAAEWHRWQLPLGVVEITPTGVLQPIRARRDIDAAANAAQFGGGIRAGTDGRGARQVGNGDATTGWNPAEAADVDDWWIELDLGRGVAASHVTLVFAEDAPPLELFKVHLSTGETQRDIVENPLDQLVFRAQQLVKNNSRHRVTLDLEELDSTTLRAVRITNLVAVPGARLTAIQVTVLGDNLSLNLAERGGSVRFRIGEKTVTGSSLSNLSNLNDGDYETLWWANSYDTEFEVATWATVTVDLGATYWVDWIRIVGSIVPRIYNAGNERRLDLRRFFSLENYELLSSDGSLAPHGSLQWERRTTGQRTEFIDARGWADHALDLAPARLMQLSWLFFDPSCDPRCFTGGAMGELQIFADGFPQEVQLRSGVIDLGMDRHVAGVTWSADTPVGTSVAVRSRSGDGLAKSVIYSNSSGDEVTERLFMRLIPSFRGAIDTLVAPGGDWSPWSSPYAQSGALFESPSPRRYVELDVRLISDARDTAASLDWLSLRVEDAIAVGAVSEIFPVRVAPGTQQDFHFYLRAPVSARGYDAVDVEASTPMRFTGARRNGEVIQVSTEPIDKGFQVQFSERVQQSDLVELSFEASVYLPSTRFDAYLLDSNLGDDARQRVDAGDASPDIDSSTDVVSFPITGDVLVNLTFSPRVLTPNGDGINDRLEVSTNVVNLVERRPIRLQVFDLAGRMVWELSKSRGAGPLALAWDGHGQSGDLLPPGNYLVRLQVVGDARTQSMARVLSIAY